jgi:hypothetical protein
LHIDDSLPRPDCSRHDRENGPSRGEELRPSIHQMLNNG